MSIEEIDLHQILNPIHREGVRNACSLLFIYRRRSSRRGLGEGSGFKTRFTADPPYFWASFTLNPTKGSNVWHTGTVWCAGVWRVPAQVLPWSYNRPLLQFGPRK
ncbi:hypothetical protein AVEN_233574-1 [Araneus ventricosus]|uniref:Uncharacterized protein n=1 Tax=Araneus ventricosus TaxID=182803 RepID=A0A4Y2HQT1_ARAVE|nr:hypothetical protein AVEN_233574-1 [Araneus ventricosus]